MRLPTRTTVAAGLLAAGLAATANAAQASRAPKVTSGTLVVRGTAGNDRLASSAVPARTRCPAARATTS
jgi:hypothetical protein